MGEQDPRGPHDTAGTGAVLAACRTCDQAPKGQCDAETEQKKGCSAV